MLLFLQDAKGSLRYIVTWALYDCNTWWSGGLSPATCNKEVIQQSVSTLLY